MIKQSRGAHMAACNERIATATGQQRIEELVAVLSEQLDVVMARPERIEECCSTLKELISKPPTETDVELLRALLPGISQRSGPMVVPVFDLLEYAASHCREPWRLLEGLLAVHDNALLRRALQKTYALVVDERLTVERRLLIALAARVRTIDEESDESELLRLVDMIVRHVPSEGRSEDPVLSIFLWDPEMKIRRLAARLLDVAVQPVPMTTCAMILEPDVLKVLEPHLTYSRISHEDLLALASSPARRSLTASLRHAEIVLGQTLLREVIAEVGWARLNLGIHVRPLVRVAVENTIALTTSPSEAALLESCGATRRHDTTFMIVTHGTSLPHRSEEGSPEDPATKFRMLNLAHADILADFLAVAPLTAERIPGLLRRMDAIVENYVALFSSFSDECGILPEVYAGLKSNILSQLPPPDYPGPLSPDLTRRVMMFEDPHSIGEVRTLHGLKRYLHQKGLQLGFKLVLRSRSTNCSVDILLTSADRVLRTCHGIRYIDFEPDASGRHAASDIPYAVGLVIDGFGRQMTIGQEIFPRVDIFCYGNEVHYYLAFKNHPAFVRINYAPPLQGGMIDLEYFGVSKYELSVHPNVALDALQAFFKRMEFDVRIENTRVQARYDKEQAHDLATLCEKARIFFCFAPYMLDIDWTIGALTLDADARWKVTEAWADHFAKWGFLPLADLLTSDRQGIVEAIEHSASGRIERSWSGQGSYRDRFSGPPPAEFFRRLAGTFENLGLDAAPVMAFGHAHSLDLLEFEKTIHRRLHEGVERGQLSESLVGFEKVSAEFFQPVHEAQYFADLLASDDDILKPAIQIGSILISLERYLRFITTGQVQGYDVQTAQLDLKDVRLGIFVLRGEKNLINLAVFCRGSVLYARRTRTTEPWTSNACLDPVALAALLRQANYPIPEAEEFLRTSRAPISQIRRTYLDHPIGRPRRPVLGERILPGLRASPGQAVGEVVLGTSGRRPDDVDERILVAPSIRPDDGPLMIRAAGLLSTGGGILSHAGLMAAQFGKPAMIIDGQWDQLANGTPILRYVSPEYELAEEERAAFHVTIRRNLTHRQHVLANGDLVELDTVEGVLQVLGHDRDALSLHESFRQFWKAAGQLAISRTDADVLVWRGRRLRARHQIEKILLRLRDPVLACFAIRRLLLNHNAYIESADRAALILLLFTNTSVADIARYHLAWITDELHQRTVRQWNKTLDLIPRALSPFEVLVLRRDTLAILRKLNDCVECLQHCGVTCSLPEFARIDELDLAASERLNRLRTDKRTQLTGDSVPQARHGHLIREIEKIDVLLGLAPDPTLKDFRKEAPGFEQHGDERISRIVVGPQDGGLELSSRIGWKAANLAEIGRLLDAAMVPSWFAVTDHAFRCILATPLHRLLAEKSDLGGLSLSEAITQILQASNLDILQKSSKIRSLWEAVVLPDILVGAITTAYEGLAADTATPPAEPYVALRSSSHEEDAEMAARAGEFDTFLYVKGQANVLTYLKRTWSGLWGERAMHNRAAMGLSTSITGGGVLVQRMVNARVSGVLQTINVGENELREIVVNAGVGLGEGIVSGTVAADHIVVSKEGDMTGLPLRFTYVTADKREKIVLDQRTGTGTVRAELPYHQRLRPALEYVELHELVTIARRLEEAYGYPLDIEFAFEGTRLWILQVRPIPVYLSVINETLEKYPLPIPPPCKRSRPP